MIQEQFKELQRIAKYCEETLTDIKSEPTRKIALKEMQAEKKKAEFDKFYEEHCKKYGKSL
ncbi:MULTISPECIES: hypothetical protein [Bacillus]|uniref:hypothetical protein n=1 Tax=Bacillus TaxID=1386 RepID=UPI00119D9D8D|nr:MULTISPECIES: hypothetical protein [Bacillus]MDX9635984.1 hypothetical protein [Bacillus sp. PBL-C9]